MTPTTNSVEPTTSATDELRRMLDERGVEWTEPNNKARSHTTYWTAGFLRCIAVEFNDGMVSIASSSDDITPEQAIEATLGRGECRDTGNYISAFECDTCGEVYEMYRTPSFCPSCGRVVRA